MIKLIDVNSIIWCPYCGNKAAHQRLEVINGIYHCVSCDGVFNLDKLGTTRTRTGRLIK